MRRAAVSLVVAVVLGGTVTVSFETACTAVPGAICRGDAINRRGGEEAPDPGCTSCIEEQCCDVLGDCQGSACASSVAAAHACVLAAGRRGGAEEPGCVAPLAATEGSVETYQCMRDRCGDRCGLPVCKLDPLVPRIGAISCDRCFASSCCAEINACAGNRTCLLTVQCILDRCEAALEQLMSRAAHASALEIVDAVCAGRQPTADRDSCIGSCFEDYAPLGTDEANEGRCLASKVAECGADVGCGAECALARKPSDAGAD